MLLKTVKHSQRGHVKCRRGHGTLLPLHTQIRIVYKRPTSYSGYYGYSIDAGQSVVGCSVIDTDTMSELTAGFCFCFLASILLSSHQRSKQEARSKINDSNIKQKWGVNVAVHPHKPSKCNTRKEIERMQGPGGHHVLQCAPVQRPALLVIVGIVWKFPLLTAIRHACLPGTGIPVQINLVPAAPLVP